MKDRLATLQAFRAAAAALVVAYHNNTEIFGSKKYWAEAGPRIFNFGHAGVELFFVISGFIIYFIHREDIGRPRLLRRYAYRRLVRIYPMYWIVLAAILLAGTLYPALRGAETGGLANLLSSLTLVGLQGRAYQMPQTILLVAWTLYHEMQFYLIFALLILNTKLGVVVMAAWSALCAASLLWPPEPTLATVYFGPINLLFLMGMAAAETYRRGGRYAEICAGAGLLLFVGFAQLEAFGDLELAPAFSSLPYGLAAMLMIYGFAASERKYGFLIWGLVVLVGDASYTLYLCHQPVILFFAKAAMGVRGLAPAGVWYAAIWAGAIAVALALHLILERPLLGFLNRFSPSTKGRPETGRGSTGF